MRLCRSGGVAKSSMPLAFTMKSRRWQRRSFAWWPMTRITFDRIGVVARSLEAYGPPIKEVFHNHHIPMTGVIEEPLVQFPLTKAAILLLNLPAKDYLRTHVIDLLASPYFKLDADPATHSPRPDMWDLATRELRICRGIQEWRRLRSYTTRDLVLSQISHDDEPRVIKIPAAQIRLSGGYFQRALAGSRAPCRRRRPGVTTLALGKSC